MREKYRRGKTSAERPASTRRLAAYKRIKAAAQARRREADKQQAKKT